MNLLSTLSFLPKGLVKRLIHTVALIRSPYILGVRVIVQDQHGAVLLVRHSYLPGWYLPGGGVERGETLTDTARRELKEEAGVLASVSPALLGVYLDKQGTGRNHVGLLHVTEWEQGPNYLVPNAEIVEARFFAIDAMPADLSGATARRLSEFTKNSITGSGDW